MTIVSATVTCIKILDCTTSVASCHMKTNLTENYQPRFFGGDSIRLCLKLPKMERLPVIKSPHKYALCLSTSLGKITSAKRLSSLAESSHPIQHTPPRSVSFTEESSFPIQTKVHLIPHHRSTMSQAYAAPWKVNWK